MGAQSRTAHGLRDVLGPCVWHNAAGFVNFGIERRSRDGFDRPPGLDGMRVHPEHYEQAKKMCFDAMLDPEIPEEEINESEEAARGRRQGARPRGHGAAGEHGDAHLAAAGPRL